MRLLRSLLAIGLGLLSGFAVFAQAPVGVCVSNIAQTISGGFLVPIPGASVYLCPLGSTPAACSAGGLPVYSTNALTGTPIGSPVAADAGGNFYFCAAHGHYSVEVKASQGYYMIPDLDLVDDWAAGGQVTGNWSVSGFIGAGTSGPSNSNTGPGVYMDWNVICCNDAAYFINNKSGGTGGFVFTQTTGAWPGVTLTTIDGSGNIIPTGSFEGNLVGNVTGNLTGNGTGTWTGSVAGNANTALHLLNQPTVYCNATTQFSTGVDWYGQASCANLPAVQTVYYQTMQAAGTSETQRNSLNFSASFALTDSSSPSRTNVDLAASGVSAGAYVSPTSVTVDTYGRVTAIVASTGVSRTCNSFGCYKIESDGTIVEWVNTGALNNNTPTTITLPHTIASAVIAVDCTDYSSRVQSGNNQPIGANFAGLSAPFSSMYVNTPSSGISATCTVYGY